MKQILQNLKSGELLLEDVPAPAVKPGHLLIRTRRSLISAGTERMMVEFGRANLLDKARQQPDKVRQVVRKIKTDGLMPTLETVFAKLDQPVPLGYCNVGKVLAVGEGVVGFQAGDRVVSNGRHAEIVCVPKNLCAAIPEQLDDERATFTVISSIGLQGIRLLNPTIGESIAVFGLGLIGLLSVQMLKANGARVIGFDYDKDRVALGKSFGIEAHDLATGIDPVQAGMAFSRNRGIDGVLVTAATKSNELMHQAAQMSRKRGRIVLTGVTGLQLERADFYEKELTFQVSCSYGPGRYDTFYEDQGNDYPPGFVRWTENRNFEAVLDLLVSGALDPLPLISQRYPLAQAKQAYDAVSAREGLGMILQFPDDEDSPQAPPARTIAMDSKAASSGQVTLGVIGAGNFTQIRLLKPLSKSGARFKWIASAGGVTGTHAARKYAIERSTTDYREILDDPEVNAVFITTRHGAHAAMVLAAIQAGKHVFVEKPLCLSGDELNTIIQAYEGAAAKSQPPMVMVGFNRRFSPLSSLLQKKSTARANPISFSYLCNAGFIPPDHWVHDPRAGGGRIIGEACHFIDYFRFVAGAPIISVSGFKQIREPGADTEDSVALTLLAADGSVGNINYFANGSKNYPKERVEVFFDGKVLLLDNYKKLSGYGLGGFKSKGLRSQDKGHKQGFAAFLAAVKEGKPAPIPWDHIVNVTQATLAAVDAIRTQRTIRLDESHPPQE